MKRYAVFCPPSFRGCHNHRKARLFLGLLLWKQKRGGRLIQRQIVELTGIDRKYLNARLPALVRWKYIGKRLLFHDGHSQFGYEILTRGKRFCQWIPLDLRARLLEELEPRVNNYLEENNLFSY